MVAAKLAGEPHFYLMQVQAARTIDGRHKSNIARLINTSCAPNCRTHKWTNASTGTPTPACLASLIIKHEYILLCLRAMQGVLAVRSGLASQDQAAHINRAASEFVSAALGTRIFQAIMVLIDCHCVSHKWPQMCLNDSALPRLCTAVTGHKSLPKHTRTFSAALSLTVVLQTYPLPLACWWLSH